MQNAKNTVQRSPRIMGHCHLFPGGFGETSRDEFGVPGTSGHLACLLQKTGFDMAAVLAPTENPVDSSVKACIRGNDDGLDWLLAQPGISAHSGILAPAATIRPDDPRAVEKLSRAHSMGVRMLKFHPIIMRIDPLTKECRDFFFAASEMRMPLIYHTGGGKWDGNNEPARPAVCGKLAEGFPGLNILMAHCGVFGDRDEFETAIALCGTHENLYLETTACLLRVGLDRWRKAFKQVGPRRIIYGTDYPWITADGVEKELALIESLGAENAEKDLILGGNLQLLWNQVVRK